MPLFAAEAAAVASLLLVLLHDGNAESAETGAGDLVYEGREVGFRAPPPTVHVFLGATANELAQHELRAEVDGHCGGDRTEDRIDKRIERHGVRFEFDLYVLGF